MLADGKRSIAFLARALRSRWTTLPPNCVFCGPYEDPALQKRFKVVRAGFYFRSSDSERVQRFRCSGCKKTFGASLFSLRYRQKKRQKNEAIVGMLCSNVSQRRAAILLGLNRKTIVRTFLSESHRLAFKFARQNQEMPKAQVIEFDDMETFEHSKFKALSITLAVEHETRRILGVKVSQMPPKKALSERAVARYGRRRDERRLGRHALFCEIEDLIQEGAQIKSDQCPSYAPHVKQFFPKSEHLQFKGKRGCVVGQGELKRGKFDPLFSLNHTCAMFRANVNRLIRRTWCTTKKADRLQAHLTLYAYFHNSVLLKAQAAPSPATG